MTPFPYVDVIDGEDSFAELRLRDDSTDYRRAEVLAGQVGLQAQAHQR
jgi:hypothetical protein